MQKNKCQFPEDTYSQHLAFINGISFTRREIDIIACLLNARGTSKIASFLNISPRTVVTHIRNIMLKLECNSRESIIDFIEKSHVLSYLRAHYFSLVIYAVYEKSLNEIARVKREDGQVRLFTIWKEENLKNRLMGHLEADLQRVGIKAQVKEYSLSDTLDDDLSGHQIFLIHKESDPEISDYLKKMEMIDLSDCNNYYFSVFDIMKRFFSPSGIDNIFEKFKTYLNGLYEDPSIPESFAHGRQLGVVPKGKLSQGLFSFRTKKWGVASFLIALCLVSIPFLLQNRGELTSWGIGKKSSIRSDLGVPTASAFLDRHELLTQMEEKLKNNKEIRTLALVGPGGAGKTTLAHHYAQGQKASVTWEIQAQSKQTVKSSFENLAETLAKTEDQKTTLKGVQDIKDLAKKEDQILHLVKEWLREKNNWILIFDNIENFSDIQEYFPRDPNTWGIGTVILTTCDSNVQSNKYVNDVIHINELTNAQKLELFTKIMNGGDNAQVHLKQNEEVKKFLEQIPPFPLDVSIAAYYLRTVNIPYATYLESLKTQHKDFIDVQKNLLKESGDYEKTRYNIIGLSLQKILEAHPDFGDLFFFISLLDSQNIPRELLSKFKSSEVVDNFIYHLKKYSLITNETPSPFSSFSIHRSTQAISLTHIERMFQKKRTPILQSLSKAISSYIEEVIDTEDYLKMRPLVSHLETLLKHEPLLDALSKNVASGCLGSIYMWVGHYERSMKLLNESLEYFKTDQEKNATLLIRAHAALGGTHLMTGDYEQAISSFQESLAVYEKYVPDAPIQYLWAVINLANVYREAGHYKEALGLLEKNIDTFAKTLPQNHLRLGTAYIVLGNVYRATGDYEKSLAFLEKGIKIYKINFPQNHKGVGWSSAHLAMTHMEMGHYEKAKELFESSLKILQEQIHPNHIWVKWVLTQLGVLSSKMGDLEKSTALLEANLKGYKKLYGENHLETARLERDLGETYLLDNKFDQANQLLLKAQGTFEKIKHPDLFLALECLADLKLKKASSEQQGNYKDQAKNFLTQALKIIKVHFPENSLHFKRIQNKIEQIDRNSKFS